MKNSSRLGISRRVLPAAGWLLLCGVLPVAAADDAGREFFEKRIRPVLVESCYECHNSHTKTEGGLALDCRDGLLEGGNSGAAIKPGAPDESLLVRALRHQKGSPRMPKGDAKLSDQVVRDFAQWIKIGAPDPRDQPPQAAELEALTSWDAVRERRKQWWSFQPVTHPEPPDPRGPGRSDHPVDRFIQAKLDQEGLEPGKSADRATLIRRLTVALTGLPPTPAEIEQFVRDESPHACEKLVDRLLQSRRFGERWARHWMDWFRYAETHGSEGDPVIPFAWRYRDYLIRALNADVPYDQLVREHIAGDLLPKPRIDQESHINESALGIGHFRMVQHGYSPTDALDEQVTFTDNQIDVVSKAFLGLTVSCARCHNHKFDPISQADFYALYGIMASSRPALITVDTADVLKRQDAQLTALRSRIKAKVADTWARSLDDLPRRMSALDSAPKTEVDKATKALTHPLHAWVALRKLEGAEFAKGWTRISGQSTDAFSTANLRGWDLTGKDYATWFKHGTGLLATPSAAGEFHILANGDRVLSNIYPAGVYTHTLSNKHNGVLTSPRFKIDADQVTFRVAGGNKARVRLVVQNYPRVPGLLYPSIEPESEELRDLSFDTRYWKGEWAYLEIATAEDLPVETKPNEGRSWFGITAAGQRVTNATVEQVKPWAEFAQGTVPTTAQELAGLYADRLRAAIQAWQSGTLNDPQAELLGAFLRAGLLPNSLETLPEAAPLVAEYRKCEADVPVPTRAPGVLEGTSFDQPLFVRGNHKKPGDPVPRRFLEVFGSRPYEAKGSGRLELAADLVAPDNPLTARVIVNRLWHYLMGRGLVGTPDNFGRLGDEPTHPELLDYLATLFVKDGWSIKQMIRLIVTSQTYQSSARASQRALERDPDNLRLSHFSVQRLDAESIRDTILAVSGPWDETFYGPPVPGQSRRRSIYVNVRRTSLDPFLNVFDAPEPQSARGRRDTTNVPAQSLTLLNDPWVLDQARRWGENVARSEPSGDNERIRAMFLSALGRAPSDDELSQCRHFLGVQQAEREDEERENRRRADELASLRKRVNAILEPVRHSMPASSEAKVAIPPTPGPVARWEFDRDLRDSVGALHGKGHGNAKLEDGALVLDGHSYVETPPLGRPLTEKTLEAWVVLDDLDQRGGGVLSVETVDGHEFDAIVFGEMSPKAWMAGSNFFARTQSFRGPNEEDATQQPIHIVLVYEADGTIAGYRNGKPYGVAYKTGGPLRFDGANSHVVFGMRHAPAGGNKMLRGRILRAQLYDRVLTPDEIASSNVAMPKFVPESAVLLALTPKERSEVERLRREIKNLTEQIRRFENENDRAPAPLQRWQDLAHALFNFKEFLYIR